MFGRHFQRQWGDSIEAWDFTGPNNQPDGSRAVAQSGGAVRSGAFPREGAVDEAEPGAGAEAMRSRFAWGVMACYAVAVFIAPALKLVKIVAL